MPKAEDLPIFTAWMQFLDWLLPTTEKTPKRDKAGRFLPLVAPQNLLDRAGQIVIAQPSKHPTKIMKGALMRVEKRLLRRAGIGAMIGQPTGHAPHYEHLRQLALTGQFHHRLRPVHLAFDPPVITLRDTDRLAQ